jgi:UDPglucose 6-dehydrogenase
MKIGIIGLGIVGTAVMNGMKYLGHKVFLHDLKMKTDISNLKETEIVFVCVPTPSSESGSCDTSIVESVVSDLVSMEYSGIIALKSTVSIGTTLRLIKKYSNNKICFVPEFLRERCATEDFISNHDLCTIGALSEEVFDLVRKAHGSLPKKVKHLTPSEAESVKYFNNVYNATLITFANSFCEVCESMGVNYTNVKDCVTNREHIVDVYLSSTEDIKGFSGPCLPKDTKEIAHVANKIGITFFQDILKQNSEFKKTVLEGMRDE